MKEESDNQVSLETAYRNAADLLKKNEFNLAEQQLSEILKKFPDDPNALRLSGVSSLEQEKPEVALIPLQKAIRVAPEFLQSELQKAFWARVSLVLCHRDFRPDRL